MGYHNRAANVFTMNMPADKNRILSVRALMKYFRREDKTVVPAVDSVSIDVERGEFVVLLGSSGCGKTTLLRCIAGLEKPDFGSILIRDQTVYSADRNIAQPPERRHIGMVFQSYALWPHLSASENVAYPLQARKAPDAEIASRVEEALRLVGIPELKGQYPNQMSGGQQQRVALARAIVPKDNLILFDEPLSNVDAKVREQLRTELLSMQRKLSFAALYVTHDQTEAMALGHRIAVMHRGKIAQLGSPRDIYDRPLSRYVAHFIGVSNELKGTFSGKGNGGTLNAVTNIGEVVATPAMPSVAEESSLAIIFRPERCVLSETEPEGPNKWQVSVESSLFLGAHTEHIVRLGSQTLTAWSNDEPRPTGSSAWLSISPERVRAVPWDEKT
jgi:iron(III) transport system ATP-binding protein